MPTTALPTDYRDFLQWKWEDYQPYFDDLLGTTLTAESIHDWMVQWTHLRRMIVETYARLHVAKNQNSADEEAHKAHLVFLENIIPKYEQIEQQLKTKLLESGVEPENFEVGMKVLKVEADLFREENIPLRIEERKLTDEYAKLTAEATVEYDGEERTLVQMQKFLQDQDRAKRQQAWETMEKRRLEDAEAMTDLWAKLIDLRYKVARNAGFDNFRDLHWLEMRRFDYTPKDCETFHRAIEEKVVPAANRLYEKRKQALGVDTLRPWDLQVDISGKDPLKPYDKDEELPQGVLSMFESIDPELGKNFRHMVETNLLDLENRKGKAPGGFCTSFDVAGDPFIFMNAVGRHTDVQTLLHEAGHAFHVFETEHLPYDLQSSYTMEIAEVASMAMELLAGPYLAQAKGGFYTEEDARRAQAEHLEDNLLFWPFMAVIDAFQHWAHTHPQDAMDPANCNKTWRELQGRFMPAIDFSGYDTIRDTGWLRKRHIFIVPFYYVEYGLAQLGAMQVWRNSLKDEATALKQYRHALSLGATKPLPELFAAAGAKFTFEAPILGEMVELAEEYIEKLHA